MLIYLIYTRFEAGRNKWFANRLIECGRARGADVRLLIREETLLSFDGGKPSVISKGRSVPLPDALINRTQDHLLAKHFENAGVRVFNNSNVCRICNNKMLTFELAANLGIPFVDTFYYESPQTPAFFPAVIKPVDGKGGKDVYLLNSERDFESVRHTFENRSHIVQRTVSDLGRDMRLYFMGGKMIASFLRYSDGDFRSNYGLNGNAVPIEPGKFELSAASKFVDALKPDFLGIDFIFDHGVPIFNEVEDCVGSRMIYANTDIDVADRYITHIIESL